MKLLVLHVEALISLMKHEWTLYKTLWHEAIPLVIYLFIYLLFFCRGGGTGGWACYFWDLLLITSHNIFTLLSGCGWRGGGGGECYFRILQYDCKMIC